MINRKVVFIISVLLTTPIYSKTINAIFTNWRPYGFVEGKIPTGFEIEVFSEVMSTLNYKTKFTQASWTRCLKETKEGRSDVLISALQTDERKKYFYYPSEHISTSSTALFTLESDTSINYTGDLKQLTNYKIGVTSDFSYGDQFDNAEFLTLDKSANTELLVKKIINKRLRVGIGNIAVVTTIAEKFNIQAKLRFFEPLVHKKKLYAVFSKKPKESKTLYKEFSRALRKFKKTKRYRELLRKYNFSRSNP